MKLDRLRLLDALRGFALLGILLMNIEWFTRPMQEMGTGMPSAAHGLNRWVAWAIYAVVQGKFWVLFSLLFGASFVLMAERARCEGRPFQVPYLRRLAMLAVFGIGHAVLLWPGDILLPYALAGLGMWAARDWSPALLRNTGFALYAGLAGMSLLSALQIEGAGRVAFDALLAEQQQQAIAAAQVYAHGNWRQVTAQRWADFAILLRGLWWQALTAWSVFLIGAWLLRSGRLPDQDTQRVWAMRMGLGGGVVGGLCTAGAIAVQLHPPVSHAATILLADALLFAGGLPLALAWLSALLLAWHSAITHRALAMLAPAGRMALTNYLMQSLIASTLFFGYGMAWWGRLGRIELCAVAVAIFALQVVISQWWLQHWRYGPLEWLWRWAMWGERPRMREA